MQAYKIFSGNSNIEFAKNICENLNINLGKAKIGKFSDGEINIQIGESVRGQDVFIIQHTGHPCNDNLMELMIICDALKRSSASCITAIIPYFGYARQDRKAAPRVPISAKLVATMLETAGINRVITIDLHAAQIQGFFDIPVDNLYGSIIFMEYVKNKNFKNAVVASPDIGGVARARHFANKLGLDIVIVDKKREKANSSEVMNIIGDVKDKEVILIDDIIDTAGTIVKAAQTLKEKGATKVLACCTHPVLSGPAYERINNSKLDELIVSDSIPLKEKSDKIKICSSVDLFSEVIKRVFSNESVNSLFLN